MKDKPTVWLLRQVRRRLLAIAVMTAAQVLHSLLAVFRALGTQGVIDSAVDGHADAFWQACLVQAGIFGGILLSMAVVRHLRERLKADMERDWKQRLLHKLLHGEYAQVQAYHSGELVNRMNNDVTRVNDGILTIVPEAAAMLLRLVCSVVVLGALDPRFTVLMVVLGTVVIVATGFMRRLLKDLNKRVSESDGKVSGFLQEVLEKLLMVQTMDVSEEVERRTDILLDDRYALQRKRKNIAVVTNTGLNAIFLGVSFLALIWCALQLLRQEMSFGTLTAVIQLVGLLQAPFANLSGIVPQYAAMTASAERLMELDEIQSETTPVREDAHCLYGRMEAVCAEDLSFSYDRDQILKDAEFSLPKGAFAVVTGPSGIGKSTILKLLLGVFRPESGELYLRCSDGNEPLDRSTRRLFAYVPQGNLLLSGTLRDNLVIARPDASEEEIRQAVYASGMDIFLPQLPLGLDTPLGESGSGLSEGQAQRLAIARAVLGGAPVLLLDECTSALDADTEQKVLQRLKALPDRTCIAVTHRPAALELCDCRLEVSDGKVTVVKTA